MVLGVHKGHVWRGVDELLRVGQETILCQLGPPLAAQLPVLVDRDGLGDVYCVALGRRVIRLAERRMAGASVVPAVGALLSAGAETLEEDDFPVGLQLLQEHAHGDAHDAATDKHDINLLRFSGGCAEAKATAARSRSDLGLGRGALSPEALPFVHSVVGDGAEAPFKADRVGSALCVGCRHDFPSSKNLTKYLPTTEGCTWLSCQNK
mmetsp:Transcript_123014/g.274702  ORF Transcript_123014/g.274702 Transcript_123014/m.274702 type:complete len:208 (+) Transcript_123014:1332-1955(+)